jgi:riboflavin kinase/FMN adenylyltransferase
VRLIRQLDELPSSLRGGAVAIGNFDGVHRGHARIVERLIAKARDFGGPAVVFTFDPHPVRLLRPEAAPPPLTWTDRKAELLAAVGADALIAYPTDEALLQLSPEDFFKRIVRQALGARAVVEGANFFFGRDRAGNVDVLRRLCGENGIAVEIVEPLELDGAIVSSSRVRELIGRGDVAAAGGLLTRPYRIRGLVTHGAARGAKLGFPTANVSAVDTLLPAAGVYAGRGTTAEGTWPAAVNVGPNPTFGESALKVEAHLIDYSGSLYGQTLEVDFLARLRDIQPFGSAEELTRQLARDVAAARQAHRSFANEP